MKSDKKMKAKYLCLNCDWETEEFFRETPARCQKCGKSVLTQPVMIPSEVVEMEEE